MYGIQAAGMSLSRSLAIQIRNMTGNSTGSALIVSAGLLASPSSTATANTICQNNDPFAEQCVGMTAADSIYGMSLTMPTTSGGNTVERNLHPFIFDHFDSNGKPVMGNLVPAQRERRHIEITWSVSESEQTGKVCNTLPSSIIGIRDAAGSMTSTVRRNTVYVGGSGRSATPAASDSYMLL